MTDRRLPLVRSRRRFASLAAPAWLAGCATGRTVIDLPAPPAGSRAASIAQAVRLRAVSDDRVFEDAPRSTIATRWRSTSTCTCASSGSGCSPA